MTEEVGCWHRKVRVCFFLEVLHTLHNVKMQTFIQYNLHTSNFVNNINININSKCMRARQHSIQMAQNSIYIHTVRQLELRLLFTHVTHLWWQHWITSVCGCWECAQRPQPKSSTAPHQCTLSCYVDHTSEYLWGYIWSLCQWRDLDRVKEPRRETPWQWVCTQWA